ncbi:MAG TPA: formylglycine-generating enzyme family protein [Pirellulales bacterium]|nr:formylglycine-generating enzyme family protein [Pirellulales bacterium]
MTALSKRPRAPRSRDTRARRGECREPLRPAFQTVNCLGMRLSCVPAGEFSMGNHETADSLAAAFPLYEAQRISELADELPLHRVRITRPFLLGTTAVTRGEFRAFVAATGYRTQAERDGQGGWGYRPLTSDFTGRLARFAWHDAGFDQDDRHPVVNVSWHDAQAFCRWLSRMEGRRYRLPSEAQWEFACRAGTRSRYHTGDDPEQLLSAANLFDARCAPWFPEWEAFALRGDDGFAFTAPVGSFAPNSLGLHDMHGNVWEWCHDWYGAEYYRRSPIDDPTGPATGAVRVRRGGSWHTWPLYARSSYRNWNRPDSRYLLLGFRVAAEA